MDGISIDYSDDSMPMVGYLARPSDTSARPGVLVIPEGPGLGEPAKRRADMLAEMGFVAFAMDLYGHGEYVGFHPDALDKVQALRSVQGLLLRRARLGLETLKQQEGVDPERLAAIGYCIGGTGALELALSGADIKCCVVFHGSLLPQVPPTPTPTKILVCTGSKDPLVPLDQVSAFCGTLDEVGADYQVLILSGAGHAYTSVTFRADPDGPFGPDFGHHEVADRRSWQAMKSFFDETL